MFKLGRNRAPAPFHLGAGAPDPLDPELLRLFGLSSRTLVSEGPLRVSLVALAPGGGLAPHRASGPLTIHVLEGGLELRLGEAPSALRPGDVLSLDAGVQHELRAPGGARFLLTLVDADACPRACGRAPCA